MLDGTHCDNSSRLEVVSYYMKELHIRFRKVLSFFFFWGGGLVSAESFWLKKKLWAKSQSVYGNCFEKYTDAQVSK